MAVVAKRSEEPCFVEVPRELGARALGERHGVRVATNDQTKWDLSDEYEACRLWSNVRREHPDVLV
eukprot:11156478-Lingulodinium_polyedra.AAC.1